MNIGDLVKLNRSEHVGIVIKKSEWVGANARPGPFEELDYSYYIKWAIGVDNTWEQVQNLTLVAGVNDEKK